MTHNRKYVLGIIGGAAVLAISSLLLVSIPQSTFQTPIDSSPTAVAEKLKELTTYRNEEFGFEFQHPEFLNDDTKKEVDIYQTNSGLESLIPLKIASDALGISLLGVKKTSDFTTLRTYVEEEILAVEQMLKEEVEARCLDRKVKEIEIGGRTAIIEECWKQGRPESIVSIEAEKYIYQMFYSGHLKADFSAPSDSRRLQAIQKILDTWSFSEEGQ
ncbi:hypothetical protein CSA56_19105 [candidate division KSB3 bacterium]|uniref:Uncharacterized protein n=1 Tax=candidate division KSB3 bacterium TaxID=2044937 RepID=A0A2G6K6C2_9BACT|nr:MAG: hypothetical protein CSA56_19105 [candidate division KSB3 bacterium]